MDSTPRVLASTPPPAQATADGLLDALPWGVLVLDAQRIIQRINQQAAHWCGTTPEALQGQPLGEVALPPAVSATLLLLLEADDTSSREIWLPAAQQWICLRTMHAPDGQHWVFWEDVTARKQAEAAQQRSSQLLLDMEEVAHTGSYELVWATMSLYFSDGMYRLFGEAPQSFVPTPDFINARSHPDDATAVQRVLDQAVRTKQPYTYRRRIYRADGVQRTLEAHGEVRCDEAGKPIQLRGLVQDITERVQAEQALHHSRELLQRTIDSSLDMVQVFEAVRDEQGTVVDFTWVLNNAAAKQTYGNVIGQRICQRNPGVVAAGIFDTFKRVLETGVPDQSEHYYSHEQFDGWFFQSTVKLGDGVTTTTHDITGRKRIAQELLQSKSLLQDIIDAPNIGLAVYKAVRTEDGAIVDFTHEYINRASAQMLGEDFTGKLLSDHGENGTTQLQLFAQVLATGQDDAYEQEILFRGRNVWFSITNTRLDGDRLVHTWKDVTERKQAEQEILRLKDELTQQVTDKYHALFYSMDQGFCLLEILLDETTEQSVDFRYLELNPAFCQLSGMPADTQGQTVRTLLPDLDPFWFDFYGRVARTGQSARVEREVPQLGRWFDTHAFRMGPPAALRVAVLFNDITSRKQNEELVRRAAAADTFRLRLADTLGPLTDPVAIQEAVTHLVRQHFAADRCYYCEIEQDQVIIRHDAAAAGLPSVIGTHPLADFALLHAVMEAAQPVSVRDVRQKEPVNDTLRQLCAQLQIVSYLNIPVVKDGQTAGVLCLVQSTPREWSASDAALAVGAAERTWAAVERTRTEAALRLSEERLRTLITNLPGAAVFMVGPDLRYQLAEGEALYTSGLTPANLIGRTIAEAIPPELVPEYELHYRRALAGQGFLVEHRAHNHVYISRGVPLPGPTGQITAVLVVSYDITERKQAEEALLASEAQLAEFNVQLEQRVDQRTRELRASRDLLQSVFDTSLISMSVLKAMRDETGAVQDFQLQLVSQELERQTGRTDLVGKRYAQEYPGIREVGLFDLAVQTLETGVPQSTEYYYPHEGFQNWFTCQFVKMGDGVVATNLDITERKLAEQERLKNLRLLEQAEAVAGLGSWDYDLRTQQMGWSAGMYQLLGLPLGQPVGPDVYWQLAIDEDRPRAEQLVRRLTAGEGQEETLRLRVGEQVKTVRLKTVVLPDEAGQPARVLGVDVDISELQRLETDNLRLRLGQQHALFEAVQAAQETERKRMAESLHNGIGQILYATKLRLDRLHAPILGTHATLVAARREADHLLSEAIRQTRALSHELVPLVLEDFGLEAALQDISRKMSTPQLRLRSQVLLDPAAAPLAPPMQMALYRMAQELAQNIVKHARGATDASLELETTPGWVLLRAEDNGPGFSPAAASRPGLGLRSILDRVALLGGRLESGSAPTGGAYVRIRIPLPPPADLTL